MNDWKPIESAPFENGTNFLLVVDCGNKANAFQMIAFRLDGSNKWIRYGDTRRIDKMGYRATHWMTLPPLPPND